MAERRKLLPVSAVFALIAVSAAMADPYIHETSALRPDEHAKALTVHVPAGEFVCVTVGVGTEPTVKCPEGISVANVGAIYHQARTVWAGTERETWKAHPFYIVPASIWPTEPGSHGGAPPHLAKPDETQKPTKWAVRLRVDAPPGEHVVRIADELTLRLVVYPSVPRSDAGFGFYTDWGRYGLEYREDRERDRMRYELMRDHGCNTFTAYQNRSPEDGGYRLVREKLELAHKVGLIGDMPVFLLAWARQEMLDELGDAIHLVPELIGENCDEPKLAQADEVVKQTARWKALGMRSGTAIDALSALTYSDDALDVWIMHMDSMSQTVIREANRRGVELWAYNCSLRGTAAALHRYQTGLWMMRAKPKVLLLWALMHDNKSRVTPDGKWLLNGAHEHALDGPDGPMSTVGLEGFYDGTVDYRILRRLEDLILADPHSPVAAEAAGWLQKRLDDVHLAFWPTGWWPEPPDSYPWDTRDNAPPPMTRDFGSLRKKALGYIGKLKGK